MRQFCAPERGSHGTAHPNSGAVLGPIDTPTHSMGTSGWGGINRGAWEQFLTCWGPLAGETDQRRGAGRGGEHGPLDRDNPRSV
jgi:hypothetical protein